MSKKKANAGVSSITHLSVCGFKSISEPYTIAIRPLTLLAGANSSGKSSIMQPLLLLKQTLEASYDPGALLLDGPNVKFTTADQLLSKVPRSRGNKEFSIGISIDTDFSVQSKFLKEPDTAFVVLETDYNHGIANKSVKVTKNMKIDDFLNEFKEIKQLHILRDENFNMLTIRKRCFLVMALQLKSDEKIVAPFFLDFQENSHGLFEVERHIAQVIHVPGLRGNPLRTYPVAAVGASFPGTFELYAASVIFHWQSTLNHEVLKNLFDDLKLLGLTWKVVAKRVNDTQVELQVGRLPLPARGGARDWVSIADVGFGVSQTLPLLVALQVAEPGQLVYLEQPEIHLHPRAQSALAQVLVNAANRGVRVVVETHSNLLLLGIQTLVAEGKIPHGNVNLNWFQRTEDGSTVVTSVELDDAGTFGDWPSDFSDVTLDASDRFLSAAEKKLEAT